MDPNSTHQLWSEWVFTVREFGRHVPRDEVSLNAARWIVEGFGTAGRVKVDQGVYGWSIKAQVEGVPAHDPGYRQSVRLGFDDFVFKGWGPQAFGHVKVRVLAGDVQDGTPRAQWVQMPHLIKA